MLGRWRTEERSPKLDASSPQLLTQSDFEGLFGPILLSQFEGRTLSPMSVQELKEAFRGITGIDGLTISYASNGNQILHVGDKQVEVSPMASNEEIRAALQNPFVPTKNTTVKMASPLQGVGQKLGLLKHNAESRAKQISDRVDQLSGRLDTAATKSMAALDSQEADIKDVETFVTDIEKATNG